MTGQGFLLATAVLLTLLVGASIPALYQLYQTLKRARALLDTAGPRLERTLVHMGEAVDRLDNLGVTLEQRARDAAPTEKRSEWMRRAAVLGSALGPAAVAGMRVLFQKGNGRKL